MQNYSKFSTASSTFDYPKLSQISKSELKISASEYSKKFQQIMKVKYPVHAINKAMPIEDKLDSFKNDKVKKLLQSYISQFQLNSYRKVRGDGNCFFRAIAFQFLTNNRKPSVSQCFPLLNQISLTCCYPKSIPKQFQKFYDGQFFQRILNQKWETTLKEHQKGNRIEKKTLLKIFDMYPFLDFIIILYFRAVCLRALQLYHDSEIKDYLCGNEETIIRTYSQQSEGIILHLCSKILQIKIIIYEIRKNEVIRYKYTCDEQPISTIFLLFQDNHYDCFENNSTIDSEKSLLHSQEYYQSVNQKLATGNCIECGKRGSVYEENGLCIRCYEASRNNLVDISTKKDNFIRGRCSQCSQIHNEVSEAYKLCRNCIQMQKRNLNQPNNQSKLQKKESNQSSNQSVTVVFERCQECHYQDYLNVETLICRDCERKQKRVTQYYFTQMQNSKRIEKNHQTQNQPKSKSKSKLKVERYSVEGNCKECRYIEKLNEDTNKCQACQSRAKVIKCQKCHDPIVNQDKNHPLKFCDKCQSQDNHHGFHKFKCQGCHHLKMRGLSQNGYCTDCVQKMSSPNNKTAYQEWQSKQSKQQ